jgi:predicted ATPase
MITLIEIDGFKTFKDFKVELAPFQVIVGPNGSGKSNLFDALHLLSRLATTDLRSAFQELRGDPQELFTKLSNGQSVNRMWFAVEMLVNREVQDVTTKVILKVEDKLLQLNMLKYTRLRYELEITLGTDSYGLEQFIITHERLDRIRQEADSWRKKYNLAPENGWILEDGDRQLPFINTETGFRAIDGPITHQSDTPLITIYREEGLRDNVNLPGNTSQYRNTDIDRTVLSFIMGIDYLHIMAIREEMQSWKFLHLNPEALRQPSSTKGPRYLSHEGGNLPTTLVRMQAEDKFALTDVSRDIANLVPGILKIRVEEDKPSDKYIVFAETSDQRSFSTQVLSDGTLRLLALATLRNDPQFHGILCLEEPENGVDPLRLHTMARVLSEMATDFNDLQQRDEPLRQILITTHSPSFISQPEIIDSLLVALTPGSHMRNKTAHALKVTRMMPVATPNTLDRLEAELKEDKAVGFYSIDQVRKYLDNNTLDEAQIQLKKARNNLVQR